MKKQLIINADDFGISEPVNEAVFRSYKDGLLTSTSLMANAPAFENAVSLLKDLEGLSIGVHLNIIEFSTLKKNLKSDSLLYDRNGRYNNGFIQLLIKSFDKNFLKELEEDFRIQIETILEKTEVDHIDSHVHIHAIPEIFKLTCKLAQEYNIKNIRTQFEYPYLVPDIKKYLSIKYPVNWIKLLLLNGFTILNKRYLKNFDLTTCENFIGVNYTGYMDENTLFYAMKNVTQKTEAIIHPSTDKEDFLHYSEFCAVMSDKLRQKINQSDIELINFSDIVKNI